MSSLSCVACAFLLASASALLVLASFSISRVRSSFAWCARSPAARRRPPPPRRRVRPPARPRSTWGRLRSPCVAQRRRGRRFPPPRETRAASHPYGRSSEQIQVHATPSAA
jgi:hypothetical protein